MLGALAAGIVVLAAGTVVVLRLRYVAVRVVGDSMEPTLRPGERVLVRRTPLHRVHSGQLVVLAPPPDPLAAPEDPPWLVKRAVALPGDPVPATVPGWAHPADGRVPPGQFVVLGDNAARSYDSRVAGLFPADALLGVVVRVLRRDGRSAPAP